MKIISRFALRLLLLIGSLSTSFGGNAMAHKTNAYDFSFPALNGEGEIKLSDYKGYIVLIVNTASMCGFTKQYADLQKLYDTSKEKKFIILGIPSNDFGSQEPESENKIKHFCKVSFGINFPMTGKLSVTGKNAHPFYQWAAGELSIIATPKWNFHKYLINRDGQLVDWFSSATSPMDKKIISAIEKIDR